MSDIKHGTIREGEDNSDDNIDKGITVEDSQEEETVSLPVDLEFIIPSGLLSEDTLRKVAENALHFVTHQILIATVQPNNSLPVTSPTMSDLLDSDVQGNVDVRVKREVEVKSRYGTVRGSASAGATGSFSWSRPKATATPDPNKSQR